LGKSDAVEAIEPLFKLALENESRRHLAIDSIIHIGQNQCAKVLTILVPNLLNANSQAKALVSEIINGLSPQSKYVIDEILTNKELDSKLKKNLTDLRQKLHV
jgi:hypothetical protein